MLILNYLVYLIFFAYIWYNQNIVPIKKEKKYLFYFITFQFLIYRNKIKIVNKYLEKEIKSALLSVPPVPPVPLVPPVPPVPPAPPAPPAAADIVIVLSASVIALFKATVNLIVPEATPSVLTCKT